MMAIQSESFFETPAANGTSSHSNPEATLFGSPEMASEFEEEVSLYGNPEAGAFGSSEIAGEEEFEWGESELNPETGFEFEEEAGMFTSPEISHEAIHYGRPEAEYEEEVNQLLGFIGGSEYEWESEFEGEADPFFGRIARGIRKGIGKLGKVVAPIAKRLAPIATRSLVGMIPGVGAVAGPLAGKLVGSLIKEAEMEVAQMEQHFTNLFAQNEVVSEAEHPEAHEAALTELLAAEAATAATEAEAEAYLGAALPITITIMGGRRPLRRVMPVLTQANTRLVTTLRRQGPVGRQLLRTVPAIQRRTVAILKRAAKNGQKMNPALAVRAMAAATNRVLSDPRLVSRTVQRNAALRVRTAPLTPRRAAVYAPGAAMQRTGMRPTMQRSRMGC